MSKVLNNTVNTNTVSAEGLSKLSTVYMDGVMRLSALGFSTGREIFEACSVAFSEAGSTAMAEGRGGLASNQLPLVVGQSILDKSVEFSRAASDIIATTQEQFSRALFDQWSRVNLAASMPVSWSAMGDLFTQGVQQFTDTASDNVRAASEAGSEAVARMTQQAKRAA